MKVPLSNLLPFHLLVTNSFLFPYQYLFSLLELIVGTWVAAKYDGQIYPGEITEISKEAITVNVMVGSGANRFKWPTNPDICAYPREDICRKIGNPIPCNHRMREFFFDAFP